MKIFLILATISLFFGGCASSEQENKVESALAEKKPTPNNSPPKASSQCYKWPYEKLPPFFLKEEGIVVTRIMKSCVTIDGDNGFSKGAGWMAMGFPCTGGPGNVEWKGSFYAPKMLSFIITNACPMQPKEVASLGSLGVSALKLTPDSNLLAFYPFTIQYWELIDYQEADTGHIIEVRKKDSIQKAWSDFRKNIPLRLRLYGRENAWVRGKDIYLAQMELLRTGRSGFTLKVIDTKPITEQERVEAQSRCEALRPVRNCTEVFAL